MELLNIFHPFFILSSVFIFGNGEAPGGYGYGRAAIVPRENIEYHPVQYHKFALEFPSCNCPAPPPPAEPAEADPELLDVVEYTKKIGENLYIVGNTLTDISEIALDDNPEVGAAILRKLQTQISIGGRVFSEFTSQSANSRSFGRKRRAVKDDGNAANNKVGDTLSNGQKDIKDDMKKLSKKAQRKINKKHKDGLDKCGADSCKDAAKLLGDGDDSGRQ